MEFVKRADQEIGLAAPATAGPLKGVPAVDGDLRNWRTPAVVLNRATPNTAVEPVPIFPEGRAPPLYSADAGIVSYLFRGDAMGGQAFPPIGKPPVARGKRPIGPDNYVAISDPEYDLSDRKVNVLACILGTPCPQALRNTSERPPRPRMTAAPSFGYVIPALVEYRTWGHLVIMRRGGATIADPPTECIRVQEILDLIDLLGRLLVDSGASLWMYGRIRRGFRFKDFDPISAIEHPIGRPGRPTRPRPRLAFNADYLAVQWRYIISRRAFPDARPSAEQLYIMVATYDTRLEYDCLPEFILYNGGRCVALIRYLIRFASECGPAAQAFLNARLSSGDKWYVGGAIPNSLARTVTHQCQPRRIG